MRIQPRRHHASGDRNLWLDPAARRGRRSEGASPEPRRRLTLRAKLLVGALSLALAAGSLAWFSTTETFAEGRAQFDEMLALETISVEGSRRAEPDDLVTTSGLVAGTPLHEIDVEQVRLRLEAHPWVRSARVVRVPPAVVVLRIEERTPVAVAAEAGEEPWLVDADGLPFHAASPDDVSSLPWIESPHPIRLGEASSELGLAAALAEALRGSSLAEGAEIRIAAPSDPEGLSLLVEGLRGRVVLGAGDLADKLRRLERLRQERVALPETASAEVIDLRFADRAVLRRQAPPEAAQHSLGMPMGGASPPPGRRL